MRVWLLVAWAISGVGCSTWTDPLAPHLELVALTGTNDPRTAFLHVPQSTTEPVPLVIVLHGGGPPSDTKGKAIARSWLPHFHQGIALAFPNGPGPSGQTWTTHHADPTVQGQDLRILRRLIDKVAERISLNRAQVYLAGFSAGAELAWFASCVDTEPYAGFAMVGQPMDASLRERCAPSIKRPVLLMAGEADQRFPPDHPDWQASLDWILASRGCGTHPSAEPWRTDDDGRARGQQFPCWNVRSVEHWTLDKVGHCWPGSQACPTVDAVAILRDYWSRSAGLPVRVP